MGINQSVASERVHIGFFGQRNAGKSSLVNAVTGQKLAIVSSVKGTTTDPVYKTMELLPIGPVMIIDTPGIDDEGKLGQQRIGKTLQVLNKTDVAVLVADGTQGLQPGDRKLIGLFKERDIPWMLVYNKADLKTERSDRPEEDGIWVSASTGAGIETLKESIGRLAVVQEPKRQLVGDIIEPGDFVVLVTPIDSAAPKGRLILPQQQTIRDILDSGAVSMVVQPEALGDLLERLGEKPKMVITDSQVFGPVSKIVSEDIPLTSFSILFARYKGNLSGAVQGAGVLDRLEAGSRILISEGCTHHRQCDDIGTVKLPKWIETYTNKKFLYKWTSGTEFPEDLKAYDLVVHCGGCMLNEREMSYRQRYAVAKGVPMTNYGILIAHMNGILKRSLELFPDIGELLQKES